jgi:hypothetical protein
MEPHIIFFPFWPVIIGLLAVSLALVGLGVLAGWRGGN